MSYSLTAAERETCITFSEEDRTADLMTYNAIWMRKLDKLCKANPEQFRCIEADTQRIEGRIVGKRYTFPERFITIRTKDVKLNLTDEQREAAREHMRELHRMRLNVRNKD